MPALHQSPDEGTSCFSRLYASLQLSFIHDGCLHVLFWSSFFRDPLNRHSPLRLENSWTTLCAKYSIGMYCGIDYVDALKQPRGTQKKQWQVWIIPDDTVVHCHLLFISLPAELNSASWNSHRPECPCKLQLLIYRNLCYYMLWNVNTITLLHSTSLDQIRPIAATEK